MKKKHKILYKTIGKWIQITKAIIALLIFAAVFTIITTQILDYRRNAPGNEIQQESSTQPTSPTAILTDDIPSKPDNP